MKQNCKRALSVILAVIMVCTLSTGAFAAKMDNVKQYDGYFAIGDSVSRGCGLDGYYDNERCFKGIEGSFPYLVAQAVGCGDESKRNMMCYSGQRTLETLYCLGVDVDITNEYDTNYFNEKLESMLTHYDTYCNDIANSELVTIELGTNDVFFSSFALAGMDDFDFSKALSSPENLLSIAEKLISSMWSGYNAFLENFPRIIERVRELNPDCTIVIVGMYNPIANLPITDEIFIPIGDAASIITKNMNAHFRAWANQYGLLYADIQNVETPASSNEITFVSDEFLHNGSIPTHPTVAGLEYIARQIVSLLPEEAEDETEAPVQKKKSTDISFDIGSYANVKSVIVDGKIIKNFSYKDHILTVPYSCRNADNITVTGINENGKISVYMYYLVYDRDNGYEAYRLVSTNDAHKSISRIVNTVLVKPVQFIFSLFQK